MPLRPWIVVNCEFSGPQLFAGRLVVMPGRRGCLIRRGYAGGLNPAFALRSAKVNRSANHTLFSDLKATLQQRFRYVL